MITIQTIWHDLVEVGGISFLACVSMGIFYFFVWFFTKSYEWWYKRKVIKYGPPAPQAGEWLGGEDEEDEEDSSEWLYQTRKRKGRFQKYKR